MPRIITRQLSPKSRVMASEDIHFADKTMIAKHTHGRVMSSGDPACNVLFDNHPHQVLCFWNMLLEVTESDLIAQKLRKMADTLEKEITNKTRPFGTSAPTHKRVREYEGRLREGRYLQRLQYAMRVLADRREALTLDPLHIVLDTKDRIHQALFGYPQWSEMYKSREEAMQATKLLLALIPDEIGKLTSDDELELLRLEVALSRIPGYFPTPEKVIAQMLDLLDVEDGDMILEPSAGSGHIADALLASFPNAELRVIEWNNTLRTLLARKGYDIAGDDFLEYREPVDIIVQNPPFEKGADIDHVRHAYDVARKQVVSVMSVGPFHRDDKKSVEFRAWLEEVGGHWIKLASGAFKESDRSTGTATCLVWIDKVAIQHDALPEEESEPEPERIDVAKEYAELKVLQTQRAETSAKVTGHLVSLGYIEPEDAEAFLPADRPFPEGYPFKHRDLIRDHNGQIGRVIEDQHSGVVHMMLLDADHQPLTHNHPKLGIVPSTKGVPAALATLIERGANPGDPIVTIHDIQALGALTTESLDALSEMLEAPHPVSPAIDDKLVDTLTTMVALVRAGGIAPIVEESPTEPLRAQHVAPLDETTVGARSIMPLLPPTSDEGTEATPVQIALF